MRRPTTNLQNTIFESRYGTPGARLQANFYHRGRHWIARVPVTGVQRAIFQKSYFAPRLPWIGYIAAHALIRIEMAPEFPIELVAEMPTEAELARMETMSVEAAIAALPEPAMHASLHNVAISAEAQWTRDDPRRSYGLVRGLRGPFANVIRFMSVEERLVEHVRNGRPIGQVEILERLEDGSIRNLNQILLEGLELSERAGLSCVYDTLSLNCSTTAFDILERALNARDRRFGFLRNFVQRRVPTMATSRIVHMGGATTIAAQEDPSLRRELDAAFRRARALTNRIDCPLYFQIAAP